MELYFMVVIIKTIYSHKTIYFYSPKTLFNSQDDCNS